MTLEVVEADLDDAEHCQAVLEILDSYAADPVGMGRPLPPDVRERLVPGLRGHPTSMVLLARAEGRPVGIAVCFRGMSTFHARPLINIHDLAVLPDWRGRGAGRALLSAVEERARATGCCRVTLEVQDDNPRARRLYESIGFTSSVVGASRPTWFMAKPLGG